MNTITKVMIGGATAALLAACGSSEGNFIQESVATETTQAQCLASAGYGTVMLSNGQVWLDRNLGATAVGAVGDYYQWGRMADGHEQNTSLTVSLQATTLDPSDGNFILALNDWTTADPNAVQRSEDWGTANDPRQICPCGFVVPSDADYIDMDKVADYSALQLPNSGIRMNTTGTIEFPQYGVYWSSSTHVADIYPQFMVTIDGVVEATTQQTSSAYGHQVRCIDPASRVPAL